eukprot:jgi/Astpho2/8870/fgenesh1_pg.00129_%23_48_t
MVQCGICHEDPLPGGEIAELDCCFHRFCVPCISQWAQLATICPFDRQPFRSVKRKRLDPAALQGPDHVELGALPGTVLETLHYEERQQGAQEEEDSASDDPLDSTVCEECGDGGDESHLMLCDDGSVSPTLVLDADEIDLTSPDAALPGIRRRQLRARQPVETASRTPRRSALRRTLRGRSAARRGRSARVRQIRQPPNPLTQRRTERTVAQEEASADALLAALERSVRLRRAAGNEPSMDHSRVAGLRETWETVRSGRGTFPSAAQARQQTQQGSDGRSSTPGDGAASDSNSDVPLSMASRFRREIAAARERGRSLARVPPGASRQRPPRASGQHRINVQRHQPPTSAVVSQQGSPPGAIQTLPLQQWALRHARQNPTETPWRGVEPINRDGSPPPRSPSGRPHAWQAAATRPSADLHRARHTAAAGRCRLPLGHWAQASQRPLTEPINLDRSPPPRRPLPQSPARPALSAGLPWGESVPGMRQQRRSEARADTALAAGRQQTPPRPAHIRIAPMAGPTAVRQLPPRPAHIRSVPMAGPTAVPQQQAAAGAGSGVHIHHSPHHQAPLGLHQAPQHGSHSDALLGDERHATPQLQFHPGLGPAVQLRPLSPQRGARPGGGGIGPEAPGSAMWPQTAFHLPDRAAPCREAQAQSGPKRPAPDSSSSERSSSDLLAEAGVKRARASPAPRSQATELSASFSDHVSAQGGCAGLQRPQQAEAKLGAAGSSRARMAEKAVPLSKEEAAQQVKAVLRPLYDNRRLSKDQFKDIARSAAHALRDPASQGCSAVSTVRDLLTASGLSEAAATL